MATSASSRRRRRLRRLRSVPVLPSLITLGNLFLGFLAMAKVVDAVVAGDASSPEVVRIFEVAALLIFLAMVFDALDGRIARMTNQTTAFGAQLDSLADLLTFGLAPAFCAKLLINLHEGPPTGLLPLHPKIYYFCAAVYVLCAAMRLARFNVETTADESDHREFRGLPTPGAAAVMCAVFAFFSSQSLARSSQTATFIPGAACDWVVVALPFLLIALGLAMVSRFPYPHMFFLLVRRGRSFPFLAMLVFLIGLAAVEWQLALLLATSGYVASGPLIGVYRWVRGRRDDDDADDEPALAEPELAPPTFGSRN